MRKVTTRSGRPWVEVGSEPYTRKDGTETTLIVWESYCVECGIPIFCRTPLNFSKSKAFGSARCKLHVKGSK